MAQPPAPARVLAAGGRVPDFFIVGQPKSGTTALYEMLRRHPQIFMPDRKEPRYFASDLPSYYRPWHAGVTEETYEDYLALFAPARPDQLLGEASTAYAWSRTAARLIAEAQPGARIILLLREPASYLRSLHMQMLEIGTEKETDLRKALALEPARRAGEAVPTVAKDWPQVLFYSERVRYVEHLRRFHDAFPAEQVLVLIFEEFRADNQRTVRTVQRFLGVDDTVPFEGVEANMSVRLRSPRGLALFNAVTAGGSATAGATRQAARLAPGGLRRRARDLFRTRVLYGAPRPPDEPLMAELRRRFKPEVEALSAYLERDLASLWGYDRAD